MKGAVVGGGIAGRLIAFNLLRNGWEVSLFDKNPTLSCSMVAGGLLTPYSELDKSDLIIQQLGQAALKTYWPALLAALPEVVDFRNEGSLILAHPRDKSEFTHFIQHISKRVGHDDYFSLLQQSDILQLEPEINHFQQGYYFPEEGCVDAQQLMRVLEQYLKQHIQWYSNCLVELIKPYQVVLDKESQSFDVVFDCRGLDARSSFTDLRGVRGEILTVQAEEVHIQRPIRFLHPRYSLYIVPRKNNSYLIGASEIDAEDFSPVSVKSTLELLTAAYYVHPGFAEARILQANSQCRPTLSHHLPEIKYEKGLIAVNGLYRHGYLIGPTLAQDILLYLSQGVAAVCYPQLWRKFNDHHSFE